MRRTLPRPTPPGRNEESCLKFLQRELGMVLLQQQVAQLFAGRNNWPGRHRQLLDRILLIG